MTLHLNHSADGAAAGSMDDDPFHGSVLDLQSGPPAQARTARPPLKASLRDPREPKEDELGNGSTI